MDYAGRLSAHLPLATRLLVVKADGSVLVHSDSLSYKPLNWMSPPTTFTVDEVDEERASAGVVELWRVANAKTAEQLKEANEKAKREAQALGRGLGEAARKTWQCLSSLFTRCGE